MRLIFFNENNIYLFVNTLHIFLILLPAVLDFKFMAYPKAGM